METYLNVEGCVDKARRIRPAYYWYACKETSPGVFKVFYHADLVEREEWNDIPADRLLLDIHSHIMQYKMKMARED